MKLYNFAAAKLKVFFTNPSNKKNINLNKKEILKTNYTTSRLQNFQSLLP
jgi:hypothetical protein